MSQHNIKILNLPEPSWDERYIGLASRAHALVRSWSESAIDAGLADLLRRADLPQLQSIMERARRRALLSPDGRDSILWLAESCAKRIPELGHYDEPAIRARAGLLTNQELELRALAATIDHVLDLEEAARAWRRIDREAALPAQPEAPARRSSSGGLHAFLGDQPIEVDEAPHARTRINPDPGAWKA